MELTSYTDETNCDHSLNGWNGGNVALLYDKVKLERLSAEEIEERREELLKELKMDLGLAYGTAGGCQMCADDVYALALELLGES